jgi:hypothetical protein
MTMDDRQLTMLYGPHLHLTLVQVSSMGYCLFSVPPSIRIPLNQPGRANWLQ